jgi:hypothetical protein
MNLLEQANLRRTMMVSTPWVRGTEVPRIIRSKPEHLDPNGLDYPQTVHVNVEVPRLA